MGRVISSELIVGNILIEAVQNDINQLLFSQVFHFERELNLKFQQYNCISDVLSDDVYQTISTFSNYFFIDEDNIIINISQNDKEGVLQRLINFFRIGIPTWIKDTFSDVATIVFA